MNPQAAHIRHLLRRGCSHLKLDTGLLAQIQDKRYHIVEAHCRLNAFRAGMDFPLGDTCCEKVIQMGRTVCHHHVGSIQERRLHPAYLAMQLETYIGTPVYQKGRLWGTLNFSSIEKRAQPFSVQERASVEAMALEMGQLLEIKTREDLVQIDA